ncbi:hypothetical protein BH10PSE11_BH10PSE11_30650 [soil metagenome]
MARTALKILLGFLSTAVFFAAFNFVGDVMLATFAAIAVVIAQFVFGRTTGARPSRTIWASIAIVLFLVGFSLTGDDAASASMITQTDVTGSVSNCACKPATKAQGLTIPFRTAPKALAPSPGPV